MGIAIIVLGIILFLGSIGFLIYRLTKFCKSLPLGGQAPKVQGDERIFLIGSVIAGGVGILVLSIGMMLANGWQFKVGNYLLIIFGSLILGIALNLFISSFGIYFYRKDLDAKQRKIAQICLISAIPLIFAGLWMWTDSYALFISYPLPNSISFKNGVGYPIEGDYGFTIAFYGIIIVCGALVSYFIGDHHVYAKFGKHGLLDTVFLLAFPMGLIGARLWYCYVLEPGKFVTGNFGNDIANLFNVRDGGLAIQGGALLGILVGLLFLMKFRKYMNIRWIMDVAVPTILIAQAIGRWGNFFNQEVYGAAVNPDYWWFLPKMIKQNMFVSGDKFFVPLFLIESLINVAGYFVIRYAIGHGLKKHLRQGDQAFLYLVWYGIVRIALEPLRNGFSEALNYNDFGYLQSWITAFVMLGIGILGIIGIRVFEYIRRKNGKVVKEYEAI